MNTAILLPDGEMIRALTLVGISTGGINIVMTFSPVDNVDVVMVDDKLSACCSSNDCTNFVNLEEGNDVPGVVVDDAAPTVASVEADAVDNDNPFGENAEASETKL